MLVTGIALSIDNLAIGFAPGTYHVNLAVAALVIGAVSVALSLTGLELGAKVGARAGQRGELLGGLILIASSRSTSPTRQSGCSAAPAAASPRTW